MVRVRSVVKRERDDLPAGATPLNGVLEEEAEAEMVVAASAATAKLSRTMSGLGRVDC